MTLFPVYKDFKIYLISSIIGDCMAVKKSTKKAAKKTYTSAKKTTVPKLKNKLKNKLEKPLTVEELARVMAENHAKTEAVIAKSREETDKALQKLTADVRELSRNLGHVSKDLGELMEFIVIPKIRLAMNATGKHSFDSMLAGRTFKTIDELGEKKPFTEVDILLYGADEVMAVETKSQLTIRDVKDHMERLEKLRRHEDLVGVKDKKLVGAVVGAVVDKDVKKFALEKGLCVVTIREEEEKLDVAEPETCRTW